MECFFFQHVLEPTRQRGSDDPSCLDLIFTNEEYMTDNIQFLSPLGHSDHSMIMFEVKICQEDTPPKIKVMYDKGDYEGIKKTLNDVDWD